MGKLYKTIEDLCQIFIKLYFFLLKVFKLMVKLLDSMS